MPSHHLNFDANSIVTRGLIDTVAALRAVVAHRSMAAIYGRPGVGKTYAFGTAIEIGLDIEVIEIDPIERITPKSLALEISEGLTGQPPRGTLRDLDRALLRELLPGREFLLVIDEAQRLNHDCCEYVRRLWDARQKAHALHRETAFAVAFVGGHGCFETLYRHPMLRRRIGWWVHIEPLSPDAVTVEIPKLNPQLLGGCAKETLLRIDEEYAHGILGWWIDFLLKARDVCDEDGKDVVDDDVVDAVIATRSAARAA